MTKPTIVRFLDDGKCIGYSDDLKQSHYRNTAVFSDGSQAVMYNTHTTRFGNTSIGIWSKDRPYIARSNPAPRASDGDAADTTGG